VPPAVGVVGLLVLAVCEWLAPAAVLHGWLIGFVAVGGIALGSVACLAIHALTGGRWGDAARPYLLACATTLPALLVLGLPFVVGANSLYPWSSHPGNAGTGVAALYLNTGSIGLRSVVLVVGLSLFMLLARRGPLGTLTAGLCLLLYGVGMNLSAFDWVLSLDPRFVSSAFGVRMIFQQIASALALVILLADLPEDDGAWGDWGALLLATVLGESYIVLMTYVIDWYGDLPDQAAFYLARAAHGWRGPLLAAVAVGSVGPILLLLLGRVRHGLSALRLVAAMVLLGVLLEDVWLVAPDAGDLFGTGGLSALAGFVASLTMAGLIAGFAQVVAHMVPMRRIADDR
jgi:hypothetical protein